MWINLLDKLVRILIQWKVKITVAGTKPPPGSLILANHPLLIDGPVLITQLSNDTKMVANEEQWRRKFWGGLVRKYCIMIPCMLHSCLSHRLQKVAYERCAAKCLDTLWGDKNVVILFPPKPSRAKRINSFADSRLVQDIVLDPAMADLKVWTATMFPTGRYNNNLWLSRKPCLWLGLLQVILGTKKDYFIHFGDITERIRAGCKDAERK